LLTKLGEELRFVLITSEASVTQTDSEELNIEVSALKTEKCVRCWHRRPDVGSIVAHPELCGRCVDNINGDGEIRLYA